MPAQVNTLRANPAAGVTGAPGLPWQTKAAWLARVATGDTVATQSGGGMKIRTAPGIGITIDDAVLFAIRASVRTGRAGS
jgi:hypothetical protein